MTVVVDNLGVYKNARRCRHGKDDHRRMKNEMRKAIPGSLDHDLAYEAT